MTSACSDFVAGVASADGSAAGSAAGTGTAGSGRSSSNRGPAGCALTFLNAVVMSGYGVKNPSNPSEYRVFVEDIARARVSHRGAITRVGRLLKLCGATSKPVLRMLTAVVLSQTPSKKKALLIHETLGLPHVSHLERHWTSDDCLQILRAICEKCPRMACIPVSV